MVNGMAAHSLLVFLLSQFCTVTTYKCAVYPPFVAVWWIIMEDFIWRVGQAALNNGASCQ